MHKLCTANSLQLVLLSAQLRVHKLESMCIIWGWGGGGGGGGGGSILVKCTSGQLVRASFFCCADFLAVTCHGCKPIIQIAMLCALA